MEGVRIHRPVICLWFYVSLFLPESFGLSFTGKVSGMVIFAEVVSDGSLTTWLVGASGAGGMGLLSLVIRWLLWTYLPERDKQTTLFVAQLMADQKAERLQLQADQKLERAQLSSDQKADREADRLSRHHQANVFQKAIADIEVGRAAESKQDREAFLLRANRLEDAIKDQMQEQREEFRSMMTSFCKYNGQTIPLSPREPRGPRQQIHPPQQQTTKDQSS
jgi:hypothetical protein